jgi:serine protease Do
MKTISSLSKTLLTMLFAAGAVMFVPVAVGAAPEANAVSANLPDFTDLVEKTGPAVVNIRTTQRIKPGAQGMPGANDEEMQEFLRRFFGMPVPQQPNQPSQPNRQRRKPAPEQEDEEVPRGVGSGFVISADGYVMTNAHVVEGADEVYVTLTDKREFKAKIVGADKNTDVALVKIDGSNLPRLTMGASDKIRVGEWVIAIGSPFGLDNTVTAGIISAKARNIAGEYLPLIQTDVAVNPGNSGGPLINMRGEVVGINSQIFSRSGGYMGISFAVPIDEAMRVVDQLKTTGKVSRGRIGVRIGEVTKEVAESLNLPKAQGALVEQVESGSPAEKAGVEAGDIIIKFNGTAVEASSDLPRMVGASKPGSRATVTVWRKGAARDLTVTLIEVESDKAARKSEKKQSDKSEQASNLLGLATSDLSDEQKKDMKVEHGVLVESAEGPAAWAGIHPGDVIERLKDTDIADSKQFNALVAKLDPKKQVALLVKRGDASQFVLVKPSAQ